MAEEEEPTKSWIRNTACRDFEKQLVEYPGGAENPSLSVHASECAFCKVLLADLKEICRAGRAMCLEEPPDRIWANIRATLAEERMLREQGGSRRQWFPSLRFTFLPNPVVVSSVGALVVAMALVVYLPSGVNRRTVQHAIAQKAAQADVLAYVSADSTLAYTLRDMEETYKAREARLDPSVRDTYRKSLDSLDNSIVECLASVRQNPDNTLAHDYLFAAYQQKVQVLANAVEFEGR